MWRLALVPADGAGRVDFERIELTKPPGSFRESLRGWGVIYLELGRVGDRSIRPSHISHDSEARARKWEDAYGDDLGSPDEWDWQEVMRLSRKLAYHVRSRLAVRKHGAAPVLPHAHELAAQGYQLEPS